MFVVLYIFNLFIYGAITKHTELNKDTGKAYGCKFRVLFMHRMDVYSSDLPSLFIFNSCNMLYTKNGRNGSNEATCNGDELPVNEIRNLHADNRQSVINDLFNRPINQLVNDFLVEMDAKNKAYYFSYNFV